MRPTELIDLLVKAQMLVEESAGVFEWKPTMKKTEIFAKLVAAKEREACALICERVFKRMCPEAQENEVGIEAEIIRARGEQA